MILQALVAYYNGLAARGEISKSGWAKAKISWAVELGDDGSVLGILPLTTMSADGKKQIPRKILLPAPITKASSVRSNFLWENAEYLLGVQTKKDGGKTAERFAAAKELHDSLLADVHTPVAEAIKAYFAACDPAAIAAQLPDGCMDDLRNDINLTFLYHGHFPGEFPELCTAWDAHYGKKKSGETFVDLVTGEVVVPEKTHPAIKNVKDAQSSGAALVSFNVKAFESFCRKQNLNAPIGKHTAFAYTAALNYLTGDKNHKQDIGDMTVVYFAEDAEPAYQGVMDQCFAGSDDRVTDAELHSIFQNIADGKATEFAESKLSPDMRFYLLGVSSHAGRLSVRFFQQSSFGDIIGKIKQHYDDIAVVSDNRSKWVDIPLWALLRETVNPKAKDNNKKGKEVKSKGAKGKDAKGTDLSSQLISDTLRAVLTGGRYPETLYRQTLLRIRAEHDITRGKAAIVKGYLLRNTKHRKDYTYIKEASTMALNEASNYTPYVLGRLFSTLEAVQLTANRDINTTIKDKYFNSACATPAAVFPILLKLANSHLKKLGGGLAVNYSKQIGALVARLETAFPKTLSLEEQGAFILGYYHQTQKRFEKKNTTEMTEEN